MEANYSIGEFAKRASTTIRALRYYDEIGLLKPSYISESGRRYYSDDDFTTLQKIITLKFLGYSLDSIHEFINEKDWNLQESLSFLRLEMIQKKLHIESVIRALDHAIHMTDGEEKMDPAFLISVIQSIQLEKEHKEWLKTYLSEERVEELYNIPEEKMVEINKRSHQILMQLKQVYGTDPASESIQALLHEYMELVKTVVGENLEVVVELSERVEDVELDDSLFFSPLAKEEEEWFTKALEIYMERNELKLK